ncbi:MAG: hypothetical protein ABJZ55_17880 [Fuerstiella sp.]
MSKLQKNVLAVVVGVVIGGAVNMAIITVGPSIIPLPDGVDMTDMDKFAENLKLFRPANFIAPWLAHALGTLVGAFLAAKIAATAKMQFALGIGAFFLLGGITMVVMYGGPFWFACADLLVAYLPMGYLGGILAGANQKPESTS